MIFRRYYLSYIDPQTIAEVKRIDLFSHLRDNEPDELVRIGTNTYCTRTHDSLKISNGKWYWWSRGVGGKSALDYLIKVREMRFLDAVSHLLNRNTVALPSLMRAEPDLPKEKPFRLPVRAPDDSNAVAYLRLRGIDEGVIRECQRLGTLYESRVKHYSIVVFVGLDTRGIPRYAMVRGCVGGYRGEAAGSGKRWPFKITSRTKTNQLHLFESAIDALSYASIMAMDSDRWREINLLSLGGIPPKPKDPDKKTIPQVIVCYLADNPYTDSIHLHFDNDAPGMAAADAIASCLYGRAEVSIEPPASGKDFNECLLQKRATREARLGEQNYGATRRRSAYWCRLPFLFSVGISVFARKCEDQSRTPITLTRTSKHSEMHSVSRIRPHRVLMTCQGSIPETLVLSAYDLGGVVIEKKKDTHPVSSKR